MRLFPSATAATNTTTATTPTNVPSPPRLLLLLLLASCLLLAPVRASVGDRLPSFKECVKICKAENCDPNEYPTPIPLHHRLLLWTCPSECDYTCQHIVTARRRANGEPVTQFHGKWPFLRMLGVQEPFSVLFSVGNLLAHHNGLRRVQQQVPPDHPLRPFYMLFAQMGIVTWICSSIFHTRDFPVTEQMDYFAAGGGILCGLYIATVRVFRLDLPTPRRRSVLRAWTGTCCVLYALHVAYLKLWRWDYTYNIVANVIVGLLQNSLWSYLSIAKWRETRRAWTMLPGIFVAWVMTAMSFELFDFPPLWSSIDAHSLWHLGTIIPTVLLFNFMIKDTQEDTARSRIKEFKA